MSLRDYNNGSSLLNHAAVGINGVALWLEIGNTNLSQTYSTSNGLLYALSYVGLIDGVPQLDASSKYRSLVLDNYQTIMGSATSFDRDNSLITAIRLVAGALRTYSTVEVVTDSSAQRVVEFVGGQLTPTSLADAINDGSNLHSVLRTTEGSNVYTNQDGVSVRWNPLQSERLMELYSPTELINNGGNSTIRFEQYKMPIITVQFSQEVAAGAAMPLITHSIYWFEATLKHPTPLYSNPSPVDPGFNQMVQLMSACSGCYPMVASGHTFKSFMFNLPRFIEESAQVLARSTLFGSPHSVGNQSILAVAKLSSKALKRRRKRNKRKRINRNNNISNNVQLGGTRKLPSAKRNVRNTS
jgi:hypothetical protein